MADHFIELVKKLKGHNSSRQARIAWADVMEWYKKHYGCMEGQEHKLRTVSSIAYILLYYVDSLSVNGRKLVSMPELVLDRLPPLGMRTRFIDFDFVDENAGNENLNFYYRIIAECCGILQLTVPASHWPDYHEVYNE